MSRSTLSGRWRRWRLVELGSCVPVVSCCPSSRRTSRRSPASPAASACPSPSPARPAAKDRSRPGSGLSRPLNRASPAARRSRRDHDRHHQLALAHLGLGLAVAQFDDLQRAGRPPSGRRRSSCRCRWSSCTRPTSILLVFRRRRRTGAEEGRQDDRQQQVQHQRAAVVDIQDQVLADQGDQSGHGVHVSRAGCGRSGSGRCLPGWCLAVAKCSGAPCCSQAITGKRVGGVRQADVERMAFALHAGHARAGRARHPAARRRFGSASSTRSAAWAGRRCAARPGSRRPAPCRGR
jgi:hypothetical protein